MMDTLETDSASGILERTPHKEPFYSEVGNSIRKLRLGDASHNPLYGIIHGHVGARMEAGKLGPDWITHKVSGGVVVPHRDFLAIQDEFTHLEGITSDNPRWNAEMSLDAMGKYIDTMRRYRIRHNNLFTQALSQMPQQQAQIIRERTKNHQALLDNTDNFVMVAIPSHFDSPKLWESFGLNGKLLDRIGPWSKINEQGVILASRLYRDDNPRGHDYFSYAAREQKAGRVASMTDSLANNTGKHEGSHSITDALFIDLLNIDAYNPIYEGFVGALGEDGRDTRKTTTFSQLLADPWPSDQKQRMDNAYYAGAKYWTALKNLLHHNGEADPWPTLIANGLSLASEINQDSDLMNKPAGVRISKFLDALPAKLGFEMADVEKAYDDILEHN